jgi:NAD(P)-dependent dehydrogenase (short-subunit alcohol dehydrogenase family)
MSSGQLAGKVALVTGGASGIGAGVARVFASEGAHVVIGDLDVEAAKRLAANLNNDGHHATGVRLDVTSRTEIDRAVGEIESVIGPFDVLVNNAGISTVRDFLEIDDNDWDSMMNVNVKGALLTTQRLLPGMISRTSGRIINISSMAGKQGLPRLAHYCATKFAVIGMTQSLAFEVAPYNVTVNAVCPGVVRTPLWDDVEKGILNDLDGENGWQAFVSGIPLGRPQSPEDMGLACLFLASDAGANITGESLNVSGGQQVH